jgi:hypothetical protein
VGYWYNYYFISKVYPEIFGHFFAFPFELRAGFTRDNHMSWIMVLGYDKPKRATQPPGSRERANSIQKLA